MSYLTLNAELARYRGVAKRRNRKAEKYGRTAPPSRNAASAATGRVRPFDAISFRVPGLIPPLRQPTLNSCWATATTMLVSWKEQQSFQMRDVISRYGEPYLGYFGSDAILPVGQNADFFGRVGMILEPPMSFSIEGWLQMLRNYGPLIVWVHPPSNPQNLFHLMVLVGMDGDGTPTGTRFHLNDPAAGQEVSYDTDGFIRRYEEVLGPFPPGAELVWQVIHWPPNAQASAQSFSRAGAIDSRSLSAWTSRPRSFQAVLAWGARVSEQFRNRVREISGALGCEPSHLMAAMAFETGESFSPSIRNRSSGATGLIQFMPSTARSLGTTTDALAAMSADEQLGYVERYFQPFNGRLRTLEDVYMAILWPRAVGQPDDFVLFSRPSRAYELNRGLDRDGNGDVTRSEAAARVRAALTRGLQPEFAG